MGIDLILMAYSIWKNHIGVMARVKTDCGRWFGKRKSFLSPAESPCQPQIICPPSRIKGVETGGDMKTLWISIGFSLFAMQALADMPAADGCAAALPEKAKIIYDATRPNIRPGVKVADEIRAVARPMVTGGTMTRSDAQAAGQAAGQCLKLILN
jgi:hypothetical protein